MKFLKFSKWLWNRFVLGEKLVIIYISWFVIMFLNLFIFNPDTVFGIFLLGIPVPLVIYGLYFLGCGLKIQWKEFQIEQSEEEQKIVNKLKGI